MKNYNLKEKIYFVSTILEWLEKTMRLTNYSIISILPSIYRKNKKNFLTLQIIYVIILHNNNMTLVSLNHLKISNRDLH